MPRGKILFLFWACRLAKYFFILGLLRGKIGFFLLWACRVAKYFFFLFSRVRSTTFYPLVNSGPKNFSFDQDLDDKSIRLRHDTRH